MCEESWARDGRIPVAFDRAGFGWRMVAMMTRKSCSNATRVMRTRQCPHCEAESTRRTAQMRCLRQRGKVPMPTKTLCAILLRILEEGYTQGMLFLQDVKMMAGKNQGVFFTFVGVVMKEKVMPLSELHIYDSFGIHICIACAPSFFCVVQVRVHGRHFSVFFYLAISHKLHQHVS